MYGGRPFVYRGVCRCADLEGGELVVRDLDRIARVAVASGDALPGLIVQFSVQQLKNMNGIPVRQFWDQA